MPKIKGDIEIGRRMAEEAVRVFGSPTEAARRHNCSKKSVYHWGEGAVPGGLLLARLHYAGGDTIYVLTGRK